MKNCIEQLSDNLFIFKDTCSVYILKNGENAVLIDFGSGKVLKELSKIGVSNISMVIHTNHHRDICGGDHILDKSVEIAVPKGEEYLFSNVEEFWQKKRVYVYYPLDSVSFSRTSNISCRGVEDNEIINCEGYRLKIIKTPGDSRDSISIICEIDGKNIVFCGDLISKEGMVHNIYDFQWDYMPAPYKVFQYWKTSLERLKSIDFDLLCPSHGKPMDNGMAGVELLLSRIDVLQPLMDPARKKNETVPMTRILPHLIYIGNTSYLIISENGSGFIIDYGYIDEHYIIELKEKFGLKKIDFITITHFHEDHMCRVSELQYSHAGNRYGDIFKEAKVLVIDKLEDILENPKDYNLPCLFPSNIDADIVVKSGTRIRWEEFELSFYHHPGQTYYSMTVFVEIDGKKVYFTGDNIWPTKDGKLVTPAIFKNVIYPESLINIANEMKTLAPDLLATGHYGIFAVDAGMLQSYVNWTMNLKDRLYEIISQDEPLYGIDTKWVYFYPYTCEVTPEKEFNVWLRVKNHCKKKAMFEVELNLPEGFECKEKNVTIDIEGLSKQDIAFCIKPSSALALNKRYIATAEVTRDEVNYGEAAELIIEVKAKKEFL